MQTYKIENLTFSYPKRNTLALANVNLDIERGAFCVIFGPSGCGKTTLLRHLKPAITPHGQACGAISFEGAPLNSLSPQDAAAKIGFISQSPDNQIVTDKVWHELSFGLESLGRPTEEIRLRVAEMASFFGIQEWFHKSVTELSGGQKQILALASVMVMQPTALILDEPTSQLDPIATQEFLAMLKKINQELGVTIILSEHRLEEALPLSSMAVAMEHGQIVASGVPTDIGLLLNRQNSKIFAAMPTPMRIWAACGGADDCPLTVKEGAAWLSGMNPVKPYASPPQKPTPTAPAIELHNIWFTYDKNQPDIIKGLSLKAHYGEITAILGGNGTGKTTSLNLIAGLLQPHRGKIHCETQIYALPQNPQTLFSGKTVREDLLEMQAAPHKLTHIIDLCQLGELLDYHLFDLSGGEQQRAALAKVLLLEPRILLLDEPTKGFDPEYKIQFAAILRQLALAGAAIIMVSHDIAFCAEHTDKCALFFDGGIVTENTPQKFFSGNAFYTTAANRMARHILPEATTANDIITALGGKIREETAAPPPSPPSLEKIPHVPRCENNPTPARFPTAKFLPLCFLLLTIPATILAGMYLLNDRQFYVISMLIIIQAMVPFFALFEGRRPKARDVVVIAVLCALAVAGRAAFFMLPKFKPVIAIVIISGAALGGRAGFLVGAITGFASNMFFGQGPWTPWQMFALGLIGFLAGVLFNRGKRSPLPLSIFGAAATFFIYGGIMNPASVLIFQPSPTVEMFLLAFMYGIPFDLVHTIATVIFLMILSRPMLEKLGRVKVKYG